MAGHSKWVNIKHRKSAQDNRRAKIFTRIIKEISIAVKELGSNPENNARLRSAMANAKGANIPKETLERTIKKALGSDSENYQEITFEGYGPHGIAIFIECTTENPTRTIANVRAIFNKDKGSLGKNGELIFIFDRKGVFSFQKDAIYRPIEDFELEMIEGGAEEITIEEDLITVYTRFEDFGRLQTRLEKLGIEPNSAILERIPKATKTLPLEAAKKILTLIDRFEADEDVQNIYHDLEMTEELEYNLNE
ncbi:MAG: YebC/PmpR family DNA-binding transcriptional regulator [Flavobacteriales bacterium]